MPGLKLQEQLIPETQPIDPFLFPSQIELNRTDVLRDYRIACESREASLVGRREVLSGKAKFGIFGDGKEIAQLAMSRAFKKGDWRSGYYRDQTFMLAVNGLTLEQFFAQLYAHADVAYDPHSGGRQMNAHFATRILDGDGRWKDQTQLHNSSADLSPTGSQMPRLVGLGYASRLYREVEELHRFSQFSHDGNEIAWGTIGNASCAEGLFWESLNAIGVLKAPVIISIWDDGYGISVTNEHQITKQNLSELLKGFQREPGCREGFDLYTVPGWDYQQLVETYEKVARITREQHVPAIIHVVEMTQPQGHSTSGSHERYKTAERLAWEAAYDPIPKMREWIIEQRLAPAGELDQIERNARKRVENAREKAWKAYTRPIYQERQEAAVLIEQIEKAATSLKEIQGIRQRLLEKQSLSRKDVLTAVQQTLLLTRHQDIPAARQLAEWKTKLVQQHEANYASHLTSETAESPLNVPEIKPIYTPKSAQLKGYELLNKAFDAILARDPRVIAFGEDVGRLGDVNQAFAGLQAKYGEGRVSDTGIREATIIGQAIGLALRGLRPIAEIQYLDYLPYALQIMSDDLASLHWRTKGGQKAPVIIRTRGHRLEGIWHAGSPMAGIIHLIRGIHVCVPRNMVQAAGFYNTLLQGDDPGLIVEVLNGYRLRETMPDNLAEFTVPLGVPEVVREGEDITIVTYGACVQVALETAVLLQQTGINAEIIDVQTLLPFDVNGRILESLKKSGRILFLDEDVPGGTTAYMMQEVLEKQGGFWWLDSEPRTLSAKAHRPSYGSDGAYFSKPNVEELFELVYEIMHEAEPGRIVIRNYEL
jgi:pyruvate/2-oxoglutarate/acetoin dehydrogenase E1 component/TPP-dependent pyruvate/acetoin dehydrogenase alpha subunit